MITDRPWRTAKSSTLISRARIGAISRELLLDEPASHLEVQASTSCTLRPALPVTSIVALHDLNHAAIFRGDLIILQQGRGCFRRGPHVMTQDLLRNIFCGTARTKPSRDHLHPHIHYLP